MRMADVYGVCNVVRQWRHIDDTAANDPVHGSSCGARRVRAAAPLCDETDQLEESRYAQRLFDGGDVLESRIGRPLAVENDEGDLAKLLVGGELLGHLPPGHAWRLRVEKNETGFLLRRVEVDESLLSVARLSNTMPFLFDELQQGGASIGVGLYEKHFMLVHTQHVLPGSPTCNP